MYNGINRLGRVLQGRMGQMAERAPVIEFGVIRGDLSLVPDSSDDIIFDAGDYDVLKNGEWEPQAGDRVLIAWIDSDVVVLGKIGG